MAVETISNISVYLTCDLNYSVQVNEVLKKASKIKNVILHAFRCYNIELCISLFAITVRHLLDYRNYVWNPLLCRDIDAIENVLRDYTRMVLRKYGQLRMS